MKAGGWWKSARDFCYTVVSNSKGRPVMTIGQRIAQKRKELGLSQEALGNQLGLSRQSIYKWESGVSHS